ncbi:bifunctional DNA primase/polymerase [Streptomyces sp. NPDC007205]|uniref:bifunctional DNA primase/polymerase n=1 Tax=Streptomyces sp. NPDC007205 TaxID=3154316 RepID=UPI0033D9F41D
MPGELPFPPSDSRQEPARALVAARHPLTVARWCVHQGWPVHPLAPGRKTPAANCTACREPGHTAARCACLAAGLWCHGFHAATLDLRRIDNWWGAHPEFGVGVACGPARLVVIDVDAHPTQAPARDRLLPGIQIGSQVNLTGLRNGFHTLAVLAALRNQPTPADDAGTLRVRTPSGGLHIWYRVADTRRWLCSAGSSGGRALAWQVDVRAHGGYIVAPGTSTRAGVYTPLEGARDPAPLPAWLAQELERTGHVGTPRQISASRSVPPRAQQAVMTADGGRDRLRGLLGSVLNDVAACGRVSEGAGFSSTLNRAAYTIGGLVAGGNLSWSEAEQVLRDVAATARPGQERRAEGIIRHGLSAGVQRPLYVGRRS